MQPKLCQVCFLWLLCFVNCCLDVKTNKMKIGKFKLSIRYGVLVGISVILYMLVFYFYDVKVMLGPSVFWSTTLLFIVGMFFASREERKAREFMSFREVLPVAFVTYMVANLFFYDFLYILFNFVDPTLPELQRQVSLEALQNSGFSDYVEEAIAEIEEMPAEFTLGQAIFDYIRSAIFGFLLSLGIAGVTRNK